MRLTVLVCALTCLLIAPHAYAEGGSATAADWMAMVALAVSILSVVIAVYQVRAARVASQAQTFLDMTQRMRDFRDARRMLHLVGKSPKRKFRGRMSQPTVDEGKIRDYLAFLNASAFLSDKKGFCKIRRERRHSPKGNWVTRLLKRCIEIPCEWLHGLCAHRDALPRAWILELWGPTIKATWPGARRCITEWRKEEGESGKRLFDRFEELARDCRRDQAIRNRQDRLKCTSLRGPSQCHD